MSRFQLIYTTWLCHPSKWPQETDVASTREALVESIPKPREKMLLEQNGESNDKGAWTSFRVKKYKCWKLPRTTAYILRFRKNCCREEIRGPLQTEEIKAAKVRWLNIAQDEKELRCSFQLKVDNFGLFRCHGRIIDYNITNICGS